MGLAYIYIRRNSSHPNMVYSCLFNNDGMNQCLLGTSVSPLKPLALLIFRLYQGFIWASFLEGIGYRRIMG